MVAMAKVLLILTAAALLVGCSKDQDATNAQTNSAPSPTPPTSSSAPAGKTATAPRAPDSKPVVSLNGPGGLVGLGDTLDQAKKAFPPPVGAQIYKTSLNFAILKTDGWTWASPKGDMAFEAAARDGKIVALSLTGGDVSAEPAATIKRIGQPARRAQGKTGIALVWDSGENARFFLHLNASGAIPGLAVTLIGKSDDLKLLNYRSDDPDTFIKQSDAAAEQANSPEVRKMMEDAKKKALEKRR